MKTTTHASEMPLCLVNIKKFNYFLNYLAQTSSIHNEKKKHAGNKKKKEKRVPQIIFQQEYLAAFTSGLNSKMSWYPNSVEEPKYYSGIFENIHLPWNLLQKFKK